MGNWEEYRQVFTDAWGEEAADKTIRREDKLDELMGNLGLYVMSRISMARDIDKGISRKETGDKAEKAWCDLRQTLRELLEIENPIDEN